jgi:hydroxyacylglutathione hydrolase
MSAITGLPAFEDNYIWILQQPGSMGITVIDPGTQAPVLEYMERHGLVLDSILLTHHHADHIGGVTALLAHQTVPVYGPYSARMPQVSHPVREGDQLEIAGMRFRVLEVPGHTLEHVAYFADSEVTPPVLFCGDTLFAAGCGRMFEGTPPQMYASLQKLASLAGDTRVYCTHEYTLSNLRFARHVMPSNAALAARETQETRKRAAGQPTVPSNIALEWATNPFLRCEDPEILVAVLERQPGISETPASVFGCLRKWKDNF